MIQWLIFFIHILLCMAAFYFWSCIIFCVMVFFWWGSTLFVCAVALGFVLWHLALHGGTFFRKTVFLFVQQPFILHGDSLFYMPLCSVFCMVLWPFILCHSTLFYMAAIFSWSDTLFCNSLPCIHVFFIAPCSTVGLKILRAKASEGWQGGHQLIMLLNKSISTIQ